MCGWFVFITFIFQYGWCSIGFAAVVFFPRRQMKNINTSMATRRMRLSTSSVRNNANWCPIAQVPLVVDDPLGWFVVFIGSSAVETSWLWLSRLFLCNSCPFEDLNGIIWKIGLLEKIFLLKIPWSYPRDVLSQNNWALCHQIACFWFESHRAYCLDE